MKAILEKAGILVILLSSIQVSNAQFSQAKLQLGISAGTFVYQGDLEPDDLGSYRTLKPVVNIFVARLFNPSFALRFNLAVGSLQGDEARYDKPEFRQQRNFYFETPVAELTGIGEWNILGHNYISRGFSPYLLAGVGYSFFNIKRDWSRLNTEIFPPGSDVGIGLQEDIDHSLPRGSLVFPVGVGIRYYFSDKLGVSLESIYRLMSSDYLDGFSKAANPDKGDHYYSHTVGIVYRIGKKNTLDCPVVRY